MKTATSFMLDLSTDSLNDDSQNIVGARIIMTYSEDESTVLDRLSSPGAAYFRSRHHHRGAYRTVDSTVQQVDKTKMVGLRRMKHSLNGTMLLLSETSPVYRRQTSLQDSMSNGAGLGAYSVEISVDVSVGGGAGCTHEDNGENVDYVVELIVLNNYTVSEVTA